MQYVTGLSSLSNSRLSFSSQTRLTSPSRAMLISNGQVISPLDLINIDLVTNMILVDPLAELSFDDLCVEGPR